MKYLFLIMLSCFSIEAIAKQKKKNKKQEAQKEVAAENVFTTLGAKIPDFDVINIKKELTFSHELIQEGKPFVIMFFNPSCGHCQDATRMMKDSLSKYKDIPFILITGDNMVNELQNFAEGCGIVNQSNMHVCADHSKISEKLFEYKGVPQVMIYDKHKRLQKSLYINIHEPEITKVLDALLSK